MNSLKNKLIKLAYDNPSLRPELLVILKGMGDSAPVGPKPKALMVTYPNMWNISEYELEGLRAVCDLDIYPTEKITEKELAAKCKGYDHLMLNMDPIPPYPDKMEKLTEVFYDHPGVRGLKTLNVDMTDADFFSPSIAAEKGILIQTCPDAVTYSVAESTITEILMHAHGRHLAHKDELKGGNQQCRMGFNLRGKTAGVIGYGHIGSAVEDVLSVMGMRVLVNDIRELDVKNTPIEKIFKEADVISIHIPAIQKGTNISNVGFINSNLLNLCKGTILINLATDNIVDQTALMAAIESGKITGYTVEPGREFTEDLKKYDQVHMSPCSYDSPESRANVKRIWIQNTVSAIRGTPDNVW
jgi:phosphoglycerate dehydrogenase-like enzyme